MWLAGHAILRDYPELREYEGDNKGGETGEGGVPTCARAQLSDGVRQFGIC